MVFSASGVSGFNSRNVHTLNFNIKGEEVINMNEQDLSNIVEGIIVEKGITYFLNMVAEMEPKQREDLMGAALIGIGAILALELFSSD